MYWLFLQAIGLSIPENLSEGDLIVYLISKDFVYDRIIG